MKNPTLSICAALSFLCFSAHSQVRPDNVRPADADYPAQNPRVEQAVTFEGTVDSSLKSRIDFKVIYVAKNGEKDKTCQFFTNRAMGATGPIMVTEELHLPYKGDAFQMQVPIDKYLPGRCGWVFSQLTYTIKSGTAESGSPLITTNFSNLPKRPGESDDGKMDFSCDLNKRILPCSGLNQITLRKQTKKLDVHFKVR